LSSGLVGNAVRTIEFGKLDPFRIDGATLRLAPHLQHFLVRAGCIRRVVVR
jgi:hypothetical protein